MWTVKNCGATKIESQTAPQRDTVSMKRVLVTGASGFVGRHLMARLDSPEYRVTAVVGHSVNLGTSPERVLVLDFSEKIHWDPLIAGIDIIIHLGGVAHGRGIPEEIYERVNVRQSKSLAEAAARSGVSHFIFVSSIGAQTGSTNDLVLTESDVASPETAYGRSKLAAEQAVRVAGVPFTIFRPALIYGPGVKGNMRSLMGLAASPLPLPFGAFTNRRSLLAISNLIDAILFVLEQPNTIGELFVVADPSSLTLAKMIEVLRLAVDRPPNLLSMPPALLKWICLAAGKKELWNKIGGSLVVNPQKLISFGWEPKIDTAAGLIQMVRDVDSMVTTNSSATAVQ
jgi:nucleoside-diphosphate-sugar epimerase